MHFKLKKVLNHFFIFTVALITCEFLFRINDNIKDHIQSRTFIEDADLGYRPNIPFEDVKNDTSKSKIVLSGSSIMHEVVEPFRILAQDKYKIQDATVSGYNLNQNLIFLKKFIVQSKPKVIFQEINLRNQLNFLPMITKNSDGDIEIYNLGHLNFLNYLKILNPLKVYQAIVTELVPLINFKENNLNKFKENIQKLEYLQSQMQIKIYYVLFPKFTEEQKNKLTEQLIQQTFKELNIENKLINLQTALPDNISRYKINFRDEFHPNLAASQLIATHILNTLTKIENK